MTFLWGDNIPELSLDDTTPELSLDDTIPELSLDDRWQYISPL